MKTRIFILGLALSVGLFSCNKEADTSEMSAADAKVNTQIDAMNDDVSNIVEEQEASTYADATNGKTTFSGITTFSSCATITRVPAFGTPLTPGTEVTKTIDFGTTGCTLNNGNVVKGKIIIKFTYQPSATSHTINYEFVNFYHNSIKFDGDKTFTRTMITTTANPEPHPKVTMILSMTATMPNGSVYTRSGTRAREIIAGYGNSDWTDNVYEITGGWITVEPGGNSQVNTITTPLQVKMICATANKPLIVSGVISILRNDNTSTLNYGNGNCDHLAVLTVNGITYNILL